ncbi:MAG: BolA family transcriptional regulator [Proteobacteria bacterium]|nr:BolA family transcriptional regulator [Pseudomonadota bacterium]
MIREYLVTEFAPTELNIIDESHLHAGHSGHGGAGHFQVRIVSDKFDGQATLARHRMVYAALENMMNTEIHALSIKALSPTET